MVQILFLDPLKDGKSTTKTITDEFALGPLCILKHQISKDFANKFKTIY